MRFRHIAHRVVRFSLVVAIWACASTAAAQAIDPGVRRANTDNTTPQPISGLGTGELAFFQDGLRRFNAVEVVSGAGANEGNGLGPRFNSNQCASCHSQPNVGGSTPAANPLVAVAAAAGARNTVPWFISAQGPAREARFVRSNGAYDGGVHDLFVVSGRTDAGRCNIAQPNFGPPGDPVTGRGGSLNVVFRIPTPIFGAGLIEAIPDSAILGWTIFLTRRFL